MKNYVKPSIELNKFDVEDIITTSGVIGAKADLTTEGAAIYDAYLATPGTTAATNIVEFEW